MGGNGQLQIHTSNRQEVLLAHLAERMRKQPLLPLQNETIVVPGRAMARWLRLELARDLGLAASLDLPFLGTFLARLSGASADDPFGRAALAMRVFRLLGDSARDPKLELPVRYCQEDADQRKRWQLAGRIAACFEAYQLYRDELLLGWARGDAKAEKVHRHAAWQAHLWRLLLAESGALPASGKPGRKQGGLLPFAETRPAGVAVHPHRLQRIRELLAAGDRARQVLPQRVSVFGLASMPPLVTAILHQIASLVPVSLYVLVPTDQFFGDQDRPRREQAPEPGHELLARLGRQARESFDVMLDADITGNSFEPLDFLDPAEDASSALHVLQSDLLQMRNRGASGETPFVLRADDASLRVHGCHSPLREMEVLRDQILDALEHVPGLRPHDVMVLVPDIRVYAPFVQAVFLPLAERLPFQIADRSPQSHQPMLAALLSVFELATARITTADVLHLCEEPSLLRRFELQTADLPAVRDFLLRTRVRLWPEDGPGPEPGRVAAPHTFELARQRLLLGTATGELSVADGLVLGILPEASATDARAQCLGHVLDLSAALHERLHALGRPHTAAGWAEQLERTLELLFLPDDPEEEQAAEQVRSCARELRGLQELAGLREELTPCVIAEWLADALLASGEAVGLLAGGVTFAALKPMRALPAQVLCVAGLNAEAFPRRSRPVPFDLIEALPQPGDRSVRGDDRQLFLETLLSARARLHLSWVSRSQKDDSECAPSAVLSELLEHLDRSCQGPRGERARELLLVQHPLQSFSERYREGEDARLFTYARLEQGGAVAARPGPFAPEPLPIPAQEPVLVTLDELAQFWRHPARTFCKRSLELRLVKSDDRKDDTEPFALHGLDKYDLQNPAVKRLLREEPDQHFQARSEQQGMLPAQSMAAVAFTRLNLETAVFAARLRDRRGELRELTVAGPGFVLRGALPRDQDGRALIWRVATVKAKDRLLAWLSHLLLHANGVLGTTLIVGTKESCRLKQLPGAETAVQWLGELVAGMQAGLRAPLPFFENASYEWQRQRGRGKDEEFALREARSAYLPSWNREAKAWVPGDVEDPHTALCWRDQDPLALPAFRAWSERVWSPILAHLEDG